VIVLGLTGSTAMGKSTAADAFRRLGVPVHDADAAVHALMAPGGAAVAALGRAFPAARRGGGIDRAALRRAVLEDPKALARLEAILHPLVRRSERAFLARARMRRETVVVLDIPLLYETGGEARCDAVVVVSAPAELQRQRAFERMEMTEAKFRAILAKQMPDADKRARADFVVDTSRGLDTAREQVREILGKVRKMPKRVR
jgi:dephospho-CoA kinase